MLNLFWRDEMFEIINEKEKQITISLHLEQIYSVLSSREHIKNQLRLFSINGLTKSCIDNLQNIKFDLKRYENYECIIDFTYISNIDDNQKMRFILWLDTLPNVRICNCEINIEELHTRNFVEENEKNYREAFNYYGRQYILNNCLNRKGLRTQIGVNLGVYIDIKEIINDSREVLRWCYIIAYDLMQNPIFMTTERHNKKILLFCHTMNGTNIAGILSQLLDCDLMYVDHLGPYNKLNKVNFYRETYEPSEFIIIADMVCQGNEFLRAKNIVEYLGGNVKGCAGILRLDICGNLFKNGIDVFAIKYSPEEARTNLNYSITTDLCPESCNKCNRKEV